MGAFDGHEPLELVAAGDDGQAAVRGGQQRTHLLGVAGVVQHDEDASPGQESAVRRGLRVQFRGNVTHGHAEGVEQGTQRLGRAHRRPAQVEAAQIDVDLSVREAGSETVGPVHGEGGLADAGHAADNDRLRGLGGIGYQAVETFQLGAPAGEGTQVPGQLRGTHPIRGAGRERGG